MRSRGSALLMVVIAVVILAVLAMMFLRSEPQKQPSSTEPAGQVQDKNADEEAYRGTLGKYGIHGGGDLGE